MSLQDKPRDLAPQVAALESLVMDLVAVLKTVAPEELRNQLSLPPQRAPNEQARPLGPGGVVWRRRMLEAAMNRSDG